MSTNKKLILVISIIIVVICAFLIFFLQKDNNIINNAMTFVPFSSLPNSSEVYDKMQEALIQANGDKGHPGILNEMPNNPIVHCIGTLDNEVYYLVVSPNENGDTVCLLRLRFVKGKPSFSLSTQYDSGQKGAFGDTGITSDNGPIRIVFSLNQDISSRFRNIYLSAYNLWVNENNSLDYEKYVVSANLIKENTGMIFAFPIEWYFGDIYKKDIFGTRNRLSLNRDISNEDSVYNILYHSGIPFSNSRSTENYRYNRIFPIGSVEDYKLVYETNEFNSSKVLTVYESNSKNVSAVIFGEDIILVRGVGLKKEYNIVDIDQSDGFNELAISDEMGFGYDKTSFIGVYNDKVYYIGCVSGYYSIDSSNPKLMGNGSVEYEFYYEEKLVSSSCSLRENEDINGDAYYTLE